MVAMSQSIPLERTVAISSVRVQGMSGSPHMTSEILTISLRSTRLGGCHSFESISVAVIGSSLASVDKFQINTVANDHEYSCDGLADDSVDEPALVHMNLTAGQIEFAQIAVVV